MSSHTGVTYAENHNFTVPEKQSLEGLVYNIPLYLQSAAKLLNEKKLNNKAVSAIEAILGYLDKAFKRAYELSVSFPDSKLEYIRLTNIYNQLRQSIESRVGKLQY